MKLPLPVFLRGVLAACALVCAVEAAPLFETVTVHASTPRNRPNYRIPALLAAPNGDLLLFSEKRHDGIADIGNHDIALVRSTDRGRTWSAEQIVFDDGDRTSTDLTLCVERERGRIFLFFLRNKKEFAYLTSDDSGQTWLGPTSIHAQVTLPHWDRVGLQAGGEAKAAEAHAPGKKRSKAQLWEENWAQRYGIGPGAGGVQLTQGPHKGRLVVPARHRDHLKGTSGATSTFSHVFFSDDRGATWKLGPRVAQHGNEGRLVELADGTLMMNMRNTTPADQPDNARRLVALSRDGGATWPVLYRDDALVSTAVHAGLRVYDAAGAEVADRRLVLFSNPASAIRQTEHPYGRYNLTVRWSRDDGKTWSAGRVIYPHPSSYSDLAVLDDGTVGIVYERGPKGGTSYWDELQFARFNLEWLLSPPHTRLR